MLLKTGLAQEKPALLAFCKLWGCGNVKDLIEAILVESTFLAMQVCYKGGKEVLLTGWEMVYVQYLSLICVISILLLRRKVPWCLKVE